MGRYSQLLLTDVARVVGLDQKPPSVCTPGLDNGHGYTLMDMDRLDLNKAPDLSVFIRAHPWLISHFDLNRIGRGYDQGRWGLSDGIGLATVSACFGKAADTPGGLDAFIQGRHQGQAHAACSGIETSHLS